VRRSWSGGCVCAPTGAEVARLAGVRVQRGEEFAYESGEDFVGTPAQVIAQMEPFVELGVDCFILDCGGFPDLTTVETLIQEVMTRINA
jgi:alkanesulfonate monooxygenase SsuD/methylene tetrahydromethanopterin reductase-like flavin-dependent oxidoreductase (luciferase family)